jgi:Domain of unknown function (DUF3303)
MLYMVVEQYRQGPGPVYERASIHGRMLPSGLRYVDSWVVDDEELETCFQLMETEDPELLRVWQSRWEDLVTFEVSPVITSAEAAARSRTASS